LLYGLGAVRERYPQLPGVQITKLAGVFGISSELQMKIVSEWSMFIHSPSQDVVGGEATAIDPIPFLDAVKTKYGANAGKYAAAMILCLNDVVKNSVWSRFAQTKWNDLRDLSDLFKSESLRSEHGNHFDQRFVDYLGANFDSIDQIHWRQFEGLVAEFFEKAGFAVAIGTGRNDNGVDVRVWPKNASPDTPASIIIQCKKQKSSIEKVVVKALWADVVAEKAKSGLIVTTSRLSPGAEKVSCARGYKIDVTDREHLKRWIEAMRTPKNGVPFAE